MNIKFFNDLESFTKLFWVLMDGVSVTVQVFLYTLILSIPLGLLAAVGRMSKFRLVRAPVSFYIYIMRSTPLMLQIMFIYFLLPQISGFNIDRFTSVIVAFVINYAAYFCEIFRSGIQSIPDGQHEAAQVLGFTRVQTFFRIVLPQAFKRVIPPVTNEVITLVKDTALASVVAVADLMTRAKQQVNASTSIEPYILAIIMYLILNGLAEQLCKLMERRMSYYK